jgi:hypothetical protein
MKRKKIPTRVLAASTPLKCKVFLYPYIDFGGAPDEDDEDGNLDDLDKEEELEGEKNEE